MVFTIVSVSTYILIGYEKEHSNICIVKIIGAIKCESGNVDMQWNNIKDVC